MLVLSRRLGERVVIEGNIRITIVDVQHHRVRVGIECPRHVRIFREELLDRVGPLDAPAVDSQQMLERRSDLQRMMAYDGPVRRSPYSGWCVVYSSPMPEHTFVQEFLRKLTDRYPGLRAFAEYHPKENTLEIVPPTTTSDHESARTSDEIECLLKQLRRRMQDGQLE